MSRIADSMQPPPGVIVSLTAANVKRLKAVKITPKAGEPLVEITGRNAQGKTSVLDCIQMAFAGSRQLPPRAIRDGAERGVIVVELEKHIIKRTFTEGGSEVTVEAKDGTTYRSTKAFLDSLYGDLAFDPDAFTRQGPTEQRNSLLKLAGAVEAVTKLKSDEEAAREKVRDAKRDKARAGAVVDTAVAKLPPECSMVEWNPVRVDVSGLEARKAEYQAAKERRQDAEHKVELARLAVEAREKELETRRGVYASKLAEKKRLEEQVEAIRKELVSIASAAERDHEDIATLKYEHTSRLHDLDGITLPDLSDVEQQEARASEQHELVAQWERCEELRQESAACGVAVTEAEKELEKVLAHKLEVIEHLPLPVPGLSITDEGVTFNGVPLEQCAESEKLRVGVRLGMAANPKLRVILFREGSALDSAARQQVAEWAAAEGYQVWMERVDESGNAGIVIEDGGVKKVN